MPSPPILGPIVFESFEVPERITFGGRQRLVIHVMPGGRRIVDAMGPEDAPIRWSGVFSGRDAGSRVRTLERLRRMGGTLLLTWDSWRFSVIIQQFEAETDSSAWIPYKIQLCVVPGVGEIVTDWLAAAVAPALVVPVVSVSALQSVIDFCEIGVENADISGTAMAAGQLAQYVTMWAYTGEEN